MDYDNLKECSNCGKYANSLSSIGYCSRCQQVEDYVPDFDYADCLVCNRTTRLFFEGDFYVCEYCGEVIDF